MLSLRMSSGRNYLHKFLGTCGIPAMNFCDCKQTKAMLGLSVAFQIEWGMRFSRCSVITERRKRAVQLTTSPGLGTSQRPAKHAASADMAYCWWLSSSGSSKPIHQNRAHLRAGCLVRLNGQPTADSSLFRTLGLRVCAAC